MPHDFIVEEYLADYDRLFEQHEACGGDFIFASDAFWGVPWLEAILGCGLIADHKAGSIHAENSFQFDVSSEIDFSDTQPWIVKAVEFLEKQKMHIQGYYPMATTRMRGIMDLLAMLYGNEQVIYLMLESPDRIHHICNKLSDLWIRFAQLQIQHLPQFHGGFGSYYYNMWTPPGSVWLQEDAAAILSPALYEAFILPCDLRIAHTFGSCFMHMHPTSFYPYRQLLNVPSITCMELHIDEGGPDAEELCDVHREILAHKPLLIWGRLSEKDMDWIFDKLPSPGLAVMTMVDTPANAHALWRRYICE
jgi:hypothetical protein